ncbi:type I-E CRISPR-associated protein Cse1/CasA [Escherichia coli]|nr:type I-E CRISPR-associated protein Cse1/CasA [Escherichia coli]
MINLQSLYCSRDQWRLSLPRDDMELAALALLVCIGQIIAPAKDDVEFRHRIMNPLTEDEFQQLIAPWIDMFYLNHAEHPFMQTKGVKANGLCHDELRRKKISALIPPRKGAGYWPGEYADRNRAVANQRMTGSNARWKWTTDYNRRSIAETAMYRVKQLFGGSLTLRDYDGQVAEAMALVRALNKMTKAGMPESVRIA